MAKRKTMLQLCTIKSNDKIVKAGDSVLMRAQNPEQPPYVALINKIQKGAWNNVKLCVRWYYSPEESDIGRQPFHGAKELFLSDHSNTQSLDSVQDRCVVHRFDDYIKLESVGEEDYFFRFQYSPTATNKFNPNKVTVYCTCEMPYNPDILMVECDECKDWFHPECVQLSIEEAKAMTKFVCLNCKNSGKKIPGASVNDSAPPKICQYF